MNGLMIRDVKGLGEEVTWRVLGMAPRTRVGETDGQPVSGLLSLYHQNNSRTDN